MVKIAAGLTYLLIFAATYRFAPRAPRETAEEQIEQQTGRQAEVALFVHILQI